MSRFLKLLLINLLLFSSAFSQSKHFLYFETQNRQPFFARIKDKVYSSTESGYLIIPQLTEATYLITIGFPKNILPAHKYNIKIQDKDLSYRLEVKDSVLWDVYDVQNSTVLIAAEVAKPQVSYTQTQNDEFTNVLAQVSNTPSVKNINPDSEVETKTDTAIVSVSAKSVSEAKPPMPASTAKESTVINISQTMSLIDSTGRSMIYTVKNGMKNDTVVVFISYKKSENIIQNQSAKINKDTVETIAPLNAKTTTNAPVAKAQKLEAAPDKSPASVQATVMDKHIEEKDTKTAASVQTPITEKPIEEKTAKATDSLKASVTNKPIEEKAAKATEEKPKLCEILADDKDFIALRRKMVEENDEQKMVEVAQKAFKSKCFNTDQIKNLCFVILNEDVRVDLLEKAYPFVSDKNNFGSLVSLLNKPTNISRFNKLIGL